MFEIKRRYLARPEVRFLSSAQEIVCRKSFFHLREKSKEAQGLILKHFGAFVMELQAVAS